MNSGRHMGNFASPGQFSGSARNFKMLRTTDLKDGPRPGQTTKGNTPLFSDYSMCQETPTVPPFDEQ